MIGPPVEVKILDGRVEQWGIPKYHSEMAAGIDLFACVDEALVLEAGSPAQLVPSGIAIHIGDPSIAGFIVPRSGLGHRAGLVLGNLVGVIDADYTGPVLISAWNRNRAGTEPITIAPGDRIAQLIFLPIVKAALTVVGDFSKTSERGAGGFGSTGRAVRPGT
jgi:dUTP pyrophosphatase